MQVIPGLGHKKLVRCLKTHWTGCRPFLDNIDLLNHFENGTILDVFIFVVGLDYVAALGMSKSLIGVSVPTSHRHVVYFDGVFLVRLVHVTHLL